MIPPRSHVKEYERLNRRVPDRSGMRIVGIALGIPLVLFAGGLPSSWLTT